MFCPDCGSQNEDADRFCKACGVSLKGSSNPITSSATKSSNEQKFESNVKASDLAKEYVKLDLMSGTSNWECIKLIMKWQPEYQVSMAKKLYYATDRLFTISIYLSIASFLYSLLASFFPPYKFDGLSLEMIFTLIIIGRIGLIGIGTLIRIAELAEINSNSLK